MIILVINCGSSSLKYQLIDSDTEDVIAKGQAERVGVIGGGGNIVQETMSNGKIVINVDMEDHNIAMGHVFKLLTDPQHGAIGSIAEIAAVGHRVVHGGEQFGQPVVLNDEIVAAIDKMSVLAPLHNPPNLKGIRACMNVMPGVPQVAVFDTAFHATMPDYAYTYALPYKYYRDYGVRRYGFHGTSHAYVCLQALKMLEAVGVEASTSKIVTLHLGNGCSAAAIVGGKVLDTSMGMTPAEGLVMGTRSGDLDPAILLYLARELKATPDEIDDLINKKSGLLGVTGKSSDMRDVEKAAKSGDKRSELALSIFCYRIKKYIGAYSAAMNGLNAIVFTGGIGENNADVRFRVCKDMDFLGLELDMEKNANVKGRADISKPSSRVRILLVPTNEERMIARETARVVAGGQ